MHTPKFGGQALFKRGGGSFGSETHPPPKKIFTLNWAEEKSSLDKRPFVGPTQTPPLYVLTPYKQSLPEGFVRLREREGHTRPMRHEDVHCIDLILHRCPVEGSDSAAVLLVFVCFAAQQIVHHRKVAALGRHLQAEDNTGGISVQIETPGAGGAIKACFAPAGGGNVSGGPQSHPRPLQTPKHTPSGAVFSVGVPCFVVLVSGTRV